MSHQKYLAAFKHHRADQFTEAETLYLQVIAADSRHADAHHMLGVLYYQTNRAAEGAQSIATALTIQPKNLDYLNNYALALRASGALEAAAKALQQAVLLQPKDLDVQLNLGNLLLQLRRFEEAAGYYRRVLRVFSNKDDVRAALCYCLMSLGNQAHANGQYIQAEACFAEACSFHVQDATFFYNLGNAQRELGKTAEAIKSYQKALQLAPNDADCHNNLGNVQRELGQLDAAIKSYNKALSINPTLYHAKVHLVHQKQHICDWEGLHEDVAQIRHWVNHIPDAQISPFAFLAMPGTTAQEQKRCADHWVKNRYSSLLAQANNLNFQLRTGQTAKQRQAKPASSKLKIGYLSADFRLHPLAFLISELIEVHDRQHFEIIAYSYGVHDKTTARARLVKAFDRFHDIRHLSEIDAAKQIYQDGIDILVDLTGYTQTSRSGIAALRPAPINVNWLGFPGTMGHDPNTTLPLFDYLITDGFITPPASSEDYAEALMVLPDCYQPNDAKRPIANTPTREDCHLPTNCFVFCCFNQSFKITPEVFSVWMRLLASQEKSVLWLLDCNPWATHNLKSQAQKHGIDPARFVFAPRTSIAEHLARHVHADLFLDTQPYNAHTTCSDALWMGVPVLTCNGNTFASRVAGSLLSACNLSELITDTLQDYEQKAREIAENPAYLQVLKQKLVVGKARAPLFDSVRFASALEKAYRTMWVTKETM